MGIDFLAADGHKWMLGPEGAGIAYIRREQLDKLRPFGVGWHSVHPGQDYTHIELNLRPTAARYEGGSQNMVGFLALAESLELLLDYGQQALGERILAVTDLVCERMQQAGAVLASPRQGDHRSGIVSFELPGRDALEAKRRLLSAGVVTSARGGKLRIAAHAYNDISDVERLIAAL
jgi:selenocysteine lyase/cysteine desulfurase